jgi:hypothetical protein
MSMQVALIGWLTLLILFIATWSRLSASGFVVWPFNRPLGSPPPARLQQFFKYELIFAVFWSYGTLRSIPGWVRYWRLANEDAAQINTFIARDEWKQAAAKIHRCELLRRVLLKRPTNRLAEWDAKVRPNLSPAKRIYVYYRENPPPIPDGAVNAFIPEVIPLSQPRAATLIGLVPMLAAMWLLVMSILENTANWYRLLSFNSLVMITLLLGYGVLYARWVLGRSKYLRLAPKIAQIIQYRTLSPKPIIDTFDLRNHNVILDLTGMTPTLSFIHRKDQRRPRTVLLPGGNRHVPACLRAALSAAAAHPLDDHELIG